jgi:hypothetical protein
MKSEVGGIVERGGGLRVVIAPRKSLHFHVQDGERLFVLPNVRVIEPVAMENIPALVERVERFIDSRLGQQWRTLIEPLAVNTQWLLYNLALNNCVDVVDVFEVGLADKCGEAEIVLADDFLAGGTVGNATIASRTVWPTIFSCQGST